MDLAISYELKRQGYIVGCTDSAVVEHVYLRDAREHPITRIRKEMRNVMKGQGQEYMFAKYGSNWRQLVGWKE
jgi:hypothetical protein